MTSDDVDNEEKGWMSFFGEFPAELMMLGM